MKGNWIAAVVVTGTLATMPMCMQAQASQAQSAGTKHGSSAAGSSVTGSSVTEGNSEHLAKVSPKLLTSTVHEAWLASGRNEDKFFGMVKQLAELSSDKRGVSLPNTEAAGQQMGNAIKESARRDPDQLLYAVVDAAVKQTAGATTASAK